jgi:Ras GTPase-activating protein 3
MVPLLTQLMDPPHIKAVKMYLDSISTVTDDDRSCYCGPYREGYVYVCVCVILCIIN